MRTTMAAQMEEIDGRADGEDEPNDCIEYVFKRTPLHQAASFGHVEIVELLIDAGADHSATTDWIVHDHHVARGVTPLCIAADNGFCSVVKLLLSKGADVTTMMQISPLKSVHKESPEITGTASIATFGFMTEEHEAASGPHTLTKHEFRANRR